MLSVLIEYVTPSAETVLLSVSAATAMEESATYTFRRKVCSQNRTIQDNFADRQHFQESIFR